MGTSVDSLVAYVLSDVPCSSRGTTTTARIYIRFGTWVGTFCGLSFLSTARSLLVLQIDPSGSFFNWKATSIGKNFIHAKTFLEKVKHVNANVCVCVCLLFVVCISYPRMHAYAHSATARTWSLKTRSTHRC